MIFQPQQIEIQIQILASLHIPTTQLVSWLGQSLACYNTQDNSEDAALMTEADVNWLIWNYLTIFILILIS